MFYFRHTLQKNTTIHIFFIILASMTLSPINIIPNQSYGLFYTVPRRHTKKTCRTNEIYSEMFLQGFTPQKIQFAHIRLARKYTTTCFLGTDLCGEGSDVALTSLSTSCVYLPKSKLCLLHNIPSNYSKCAYCELLWQVKVSDLTC